MKWASIVGRKSQKKNVDIASSATHTNSLFQVGTLLKKKGIDYGYGEPKLFERLRKVRG
jgi:hypothetical protein